MQALGVILSLKSSNFDVPSVPEVLFYCESKSRILFVLTVDPNRESSFLRRSTGLAQKLSRTNENKDQNATNQRNNTQFFIERQPWWLHLKNRNDNVQTATGSKFEFNLNKSS